MDARQVWLVALDRIRRRVSPGAYSTWFSGTSGQEVEARRVVVTAPSAFAVEHLRQRYSELVRVAVSEVLGQSAEVAFIVRATEQTSRVPAVKPQRRSLPSGSARTAHQTARPLQSAPSSGSRRRSAWRGTAASLAQPPLVTEQQTGTFDGATPIGSSPIKSLQPSYPASGVTLTQGRRTTELPTSAISETHARYVFETFIVGTANRLAYAAAQQVVREPGQQYNPLLIYGGVGLGKTHLMLAIGHAAAARGLTVAYVTAERFTNEIIEAIRLRTTDAFRARYREVDVLLVDDIQFIAGKESTEEEFFHTFNALHEGNKQIVLSSDRVPRAMQHLHDRLRSRFEWGLIADIQPPDAAHRLAIVRMKARALGLSLTDEVLVALARPECESIRALEGALNRVIARARMLRQELDAQLVADALAPLAGEHLNRSLEGYEVVSAVARYFQMQPEDLAGKSREHSIAWARQVAMYLLREETPASLSQIGRQLGGRDHTTVMHGCAHVGDEILKSARARTEVAAIRGLLRV